MGDERYGGETVLDESPQIEDLVRRLREVEDQLTRAERRHEEWLALVSHDLRGPLTLILGYGDNLLRRADATREPSRSTREVESIVTAARRLNKMVGQVVEGARLQGQHLTLSIRPIDLLPVLEKAARTAGKLYPTHSFRSNLADSLPPVSADPFAVETIVGTLLSNAAVFSPEDGPVFLRTDYDRKQVVVSVFDRGIGLSEEERCHVFEQKYRPERALNLRREGLGCSLWIARELAGLMGGSVDLHSDGPGLGTTAALCLPRASELELSRNATDF